MRLGLIDVEKACPGWRRLVCITPVMTSWLGTWIRLALACVGCAGDDQLVGQVNKAGPGLCRLLREESEAYRACAST